MKQPLTKLSIDTNHPDSIPQAEVVLSLWTAVFSAMTRLLTESTWAQLGQIIDIIYLATLIYSHHVSIFRDQTLH